ncbi:hypothetical protein LX32DRAFT_656196 [Colletotrichum zoysiae]|uniref:Uncharacterized protein n=1 Tax=Colletotrichum zoysiae TaxID=1216348 RepID=A0AAD9H933_9PEZI|nr:hypothetical protein LX32DRAFT_656196 [Colletotrichum zoysiae]
MGSGTFGSWRTSLAGLLVLLTLVLAAVAQELGVALDKAALKDASIACYSSKLTFEKDASELFDDAQLYGLAQRAYEEMRSRFAADHMHEMMQPVMMGAMSVGKDVYLSSSLRGGPFLYTYADDRSKPEVVLALDRCQTALQQDSDRPIDKQHRTSANCAEVVALHQYYLDKDVSEEARKNPPPIRVAAFGKGGVSGKTMAQNPCGGGAAVVDGVVTWGCRQFMAEEKITVPKKPKPAAMKLPDPFPAFTGKQISVVCPGLLGPDGDPSGSCGSGSCKHG